MRSWFSFWRLFFFILGRVLATFGWAALLTAVVLALIGNWIPEPHPVLRASVLLLVIAVVGTRFVPVLGPHLIGLTGGVTVTAGGWYGQLQWYIYGTNYPDHPLISLLLAVGATYVGYLLYRGYVWSAAPRVYSMRPTFDRVV